MGYCITVCIWTRVACKDTDFGLNKSVQEGLTSGKAATSLAAAAISAMPFCAITASCKKPSTKAYRKPWRYMRASRQLELHNQCMQITTVQQMKVCSSSEVDSGLLNCSVAQLQLNSSRGQSLLRLSCMLDTRSQAGLCIGHAVSSSQRKDSYGWYRLKRKQSHVKDDDTQSSVTQRTTDLLVACHL